jgi:hypothetical protein
MNPTDLLERFSSRGDVACFLVGSVAGYIFQALLQLHGFGSDAEVSTLGGVAGLAIKKSVDALRGESEDAVPNEAFKEAIRRLQEEGLHEQANLLEADAMLAQAGLLSPDQGKLSLESAIDAYRAALRRRLASNAEHEALGPVAPTDPAE